MARIVFSTIDDSPKAKQIATRLVEERLAACVNIIPKVSSVYKWQGKVETATEDLLVIKTWPDRLPALLARLEELHPYDVPEAVAFSIEDGLPAYLDWVKQETR